MILSRTYFIRVLRAEDRSMEPPIRRGSLYSDLEVGAWSYP